MWGSGAETPHILSPGDPVPKSQCSENVHEADGV